MNTLLRCEELTVQFDHQKVLDKLSFPVEKGDYLSIVGKNGSGKSTLIRALLGLCPIHSGRITRAEGFRAHDIGYLPQQSSIQRDFPASVEEVVLSGTIGRRKFSPWYTKEDRTEARRHMERLGIYDKRMESYRTLSGGQQQRVLLARALCATRQLLLLDEPVTGLDTQVSSELYALIRELNKKDGIAIIMVSHDLEKGLQDAKHILCLDDKPHYFSDFEHFRTHQREYHGWNI